MRNYDRLHRADVIAVFENQDDADEALLRLELSGFREDHIGYFVSHPTQGLCNLLCHDYSFMGALIGGTIGAVLGAVLAPMVNQWSGDAWGVFDPLGITATMSVFGMLFVGLIGWCIGVGIPRAEVAVPTIDPKVGSFILAVSAGEARNEAWSIIRDSGGHELPPGAMTAAPTAV
jgi:hypothetical protein